MNKTILAGTVLIDTREVNVFCRIKITDGNLSITGVEGPMRSGDARGSCGQILDTFSDPTFLPSKDIDTARLQKVWKYWHLNDMRPGCIHQFAEGWDTRPIDVSKPLRSYGKHFDGQKSDSWNMLTWVKRSEHPEGLLCEPCSTCGVKYGTNWLREELPTEVIEFLTNLPDSTIIPAWV